MSCPLIFRHLLHENVLRRWKEQYEAQGENAWQEALVVARSAGNTTEATDKARLKELEAALGRAHLEIEFLRFALEKRVRAAGTGEDRAGVLREEAVHVAVVALPVAGRVAVAFVWQARRTALRRTAGVCG